MSSTVNPVMLEPRHLGDIDHLHDVQERATGLEPDRVMPLKEPVLLGMGFEDEDGRLRGAFILEAIGELTFVGVDPDSTDAAVSLAPAMIEFLQNRGIRWLRCFVPKQDGLIEKLQPKFEAAGFHRADDRFAHFALDLRK